MHSHSWLNSAKHILEEYDGKMPLAAWLKEHFRVHKKFGSRDRKQIAQICYSYYRLGHSFAHLPLQDKMIMGVFLCSAAPGRILQDLMPEWNEKTILSPQDKLKMVNAEDEVGSIFPYTDYLSEEIDPYSFALSLLVQPLLFLRMRPGYEKRALQKLGDSALAFEQHSTYCLALPNGTRVEEVLLVDEEVVVQDLNSQKTLDQLPLASFDGNTITVWDCCSASGGKSLLLYDRYPQLDLLVSDLRTTIIHNLERRFHLAGVKHYQSMIHDAAEKPLHRQFNLVICDAPCTGSGTWSRTPEQMYFFSPEKIHYYSGLQRKIGQNAAKSVKPNGYFLYITCSVFKEENEEVVSFLQQEAGLVLQSMQYLKGYDQKGDSLFAALFTRLS